MAAMGNIPDMTRDKIYYRVFHNMVCFCEEENSCLNDYSLLIVTGRANCVSSKIKYMYCNTESTA
jgi:hypothetical protein